MKRRVKRVLSAETVTEAMGLPRRRDALVDNELATGAELPRVEHAKTRDLPPPDPSSSSGNDQRKAGADLPDGQVELRPRCRRRLF
jgi:hypothetical protein